MSDTGQDIGRHIGRYATDMSIDTQPTLNRVSVDMSTDMLADSVGRYSVEGVLLNRHDPVLLFTESIF